jgi:hypothetical protein
VNPRFLTELALALVEVASRHGVITYGQLSDRFEPMLGYRMAPQAWAQPLGELSLISVENGLPAISALVINKDLQMPGEGFFNFVGRLRGWQAIAPNQWEALWCKELKQVYQCEDWGKLIDSLR